MNKETGTLVLLGAAHSLNHSLFLVLPPLLGNISQDLGVSYQSLGLVATVTYFIYGAGALIGGPLSDTFGSVRVAQISVVITGISSLLFLFCHDIVVFSIAMFLMALWASFYHPTANGLIAKAFQRNTGNAMGLHNAAGNLGQVATPTVAFLIGVAFDWRWSYVFFGILSVIIGLSMSRLNVDEQHVKTKLRFPLMDFLKVPNLWMILVFNMVVGFLFRGVEVFFPTFLRVGWGLSGETAALASSLILLFGTAGQLIGGRGSDLYGSMNMLLFSSVGVLFSFLLLFLAPSSFVTMLAFTLIYGITVFSQQPASTNLVNKLTPRSLLGFSYGIMFFFSFGLGSVSAAVLGYLTDAYNISTAFSLNVGVAILLLGLTLYIYRKLGKI